MQGVDRALWWCAPGKVELYHARGRLSSDLARGTSSHGEQQTLRLALLSTEMEPMTALVDECRLGCLQVVLAVAAITAVVYP